MLYVSLFFTSKTENVQFCENFRQKPNHLQNRNFKAYVGMLADEKKCKRIKSASFWGAHLSLFACMSV